MGEKPTMSFTDYMKRYLDDKTNLKSIVAERAVKSREKGNEIDHIVDVVDYCLIPVPNSNHDIYDRRITEGYIIGLWKEYCAACNRDPLK